METSSLSKFHTLTIEADRIVLHRTDVFSGEFKEKILRFDQIWYVDDVPKQFNWWMSILGSFGNLFYYDQGKIRIVFHQSERRKPLEILTGDLSGNELRNIVTRINTTRKAWRQSKSIINS